MTFFVYVLYLCKFKNRNNNNTHNRTKTRTMEKNDQLQAMLDAYEKANAPKFVPKEPTKEFNKDNYFTIYDLGEKELSKTKDVRILPNPKGGSPIVEFHGHVVVVDGDKRTFPCLKHEKGEACPFCEAREELLATGTESDKELAKKYKAKQMYIVKLIDRSQEDFGPKFWRFNSDYQKKGAYDMIMGAVRSLKKYQAVMDPNEGRDLSINIQRTDKGVPIVSSVVAQDSDVLTEDPELMAKWLADDRTWESVYSVKNYEYLEIIVKGGVPVWDKELKRFVDKDGVKNEVPEAESEISMGIENIKSNILAATEPTEAITPTSTDDEGDDLPF